MFEGQQVGIATGNYVAPATYVSYQPSVQAALTAPLVPRTAPIRPGINAAPQLNVQRQQVAQTTGLARQRLQGRVETNINSNGSPRLVARTPIMDNSQPKKLKASRSAGPSGGGENGYVPYDSAPQPYTRMTLQPVQDDIYSPGDEVFYGAPAQPVGSLYDIGIGLQDQIAIQNVGNKVKQFGGGYEFSNTDPGVVWVSQNGPYDREGVPITTGYPGLGMSGVVAKSTGVYGDKNAPLVPTLAGYVGATNMLGGTANTLYRYGAAPQVSPYGTGSYGTPTISGKVVATQPSDTYNPGFQAQNPGYDYSRGTNPNAPGQKPQRPGTPPGSGPSGTISGEGPPIGYIPQGSYPYPRDVNVGVDVPVSVSAILQGAPNWIAPNMVNPGLDVFESPMQRPQPAAPGEYTFVQLQPPGMGVLDIPDDQPMFYGRDPNTGIVTQAPHENAPLPVPEQKLQAAREAVEGQYGPAVQQMYEDPLFGRPAVEQMNAAGEARTRAKQFGRAYNEYQYPPRQGYQYTGPTVSGGVVGGVSLSTQQTGEAQERPEPGFHGWGNRFFSVTPENKRLRGAQLTAAEKEREELGRREADARTAANTGYGHVLNEVGQAQRAERKNLYDMYGQFAKEREVTPADIDRVVSRITTQAPKPGPERDQLIRNANMEPQFQAAGIRFDQWKDYVNPSGVATLEGKVLTNQRRQIAKDIETATQQEEIIRKKARTKKAVEDAKQAGLRTDILIKEAPDLVQIKKNQVALQGLQIEAKRLQNLNAPKKAQLAIANAIKDLEVKDQSLVNSNKATILSKLNQFNALNKRIGDIADPDDPAYRAAATQMDRLFGLEETQVVVDPKTGQETLQPTGVRPGLQDLNDQLAALQRAEQSRLKKSLSVKGTTKAPAPAAAPAATPKAAPVAQKATAEKLSMPPPSAPLQKGTAAYKAAAQQALRQAKGDTTKAKGLLQDYVDQSYKMLSPYMPPNPGVEVTQPYLGKSGEELIPAEGVDAPVYGGKITPMRAQSRFPITDAVSRILPQVEPPVQGMEMAQPSLQIEKTISDNMIRASLNHMLRRHGLTGEDPEEAKKRVREALEMVLSRP